MVRLPHIETIRWFAVRAFTFKLADFGLELRDQGLGNLILKGENVGDFTVVALRPNVITSGRIDKLG